MKIKIERIYTVKKKDHIVVNFLPYVGFAKFLFPKNEAEYVLDVGWLLWGFTLSVYI